MSTTQIAISRKCIVLRMTLVISGTNFQQHRKDFILNIEERMIGAKHEKCECIGSTIDGACYVLEINPDSEEGLMKFLQAYCQKCNIEFVVE